MECPNCRLINPEVALRCECGYDFATRTAVPKDDSSPTQPATFVGAGFGVRVAARIIDMIVHYVIWFFSSLVVLFGIGIYAAAAQTAFEPLASKMATPAWYGFVAAGVGATLYHAVMEGMHGATLGKRVLGLMVISSNGSAARFPAALGRSLAFFVDSLFFGLVAYQSMEQPLQQRLGDKWCNTIVLKRSKLPDGKVETKMSFWGAFMVALLADGACYLAAVYIKVA